MKNMIERTLDREDIRTLLRDSRVTVILGPRQSGKMTIARQFKASDYFDLENPRDLKRLDTPQLALEGQEGLIVIDEIQRKPEIFPLLRYLVDTVSEQEYLILGSAYAAELRNTCRPCVLL